MTEWGPVAGAVAVGWWCTWVVVHSRIRVAGGATRLAGLLAYELVALPFVVVGVLVLMAAPATRGIASQVPVPAAIAVGALAGALAWALLTGLTGLRDLRRPRSRRRLLTGITVSGWSAVAEEVLFRGLLVLSLAAATGPWVAAGVSALVFGAHHLPVAGIRGALLHTGTGAVFAAVAVAGPGLAGAAAAHVTYNVLAAAVREGHLVAARTERARIPLRVTSSPGQGGSA